MINISESKRAGPVTSRSKVIEINLITVLIYSREINCCCLASIQRSYRSCKVLNERIIFYNNILLKDFTICRCELDRECPRDTSPSASNLIDLNHWLAFDCSKSTKAEIRSRISIRDYKQSLSSDHACQVISIKSITIVILKTAQREIILIRSKLRNGKPTISSLCTILSYLAKSNLIKISLSRYFQSFISSKRGVSYHIGNKYRNLFYYHVCVCATKLKSNFSSIRIICGRICHTCCDRKT